MFIGRQQDMEQLNRAFNSDGFVLAAIYGRRHIGKTALISEFIKDKDAIYFSARELTDKYNLEAFTQKIAEHFGLSVDGINCWEAAFENVHNNMADRRLVLVLDNYTNTCLTNKEISTVIGNAVQKYFKNSKLFLILCCNHMSAFDREFFSKDSPLKDYISVDLNVKGLPFEDARTFMEGFNAEEQSKLYSCIGGTPLYLSLIDSSKSVDENIDNLFFRSGGFIRNDLSMALQKELIGPAVYNSILRAIAFGKNRSKEIMEDIGEEKGKTHKYISVLISMGILYREVPDGEDPLVSRKGTYHFEDNAYRFWYRYVLDNMSEHEIDVKWEEAFSL